MKIIFLSLLVCLNLWAKPQICEYSLESKNFNVGWKAFKTPKKVGVGGAFDKVYLNSIVSRSINEVIYGASFAFDTSSTNTKNKARDAKIVRFFFNQMTGGKLIKGMVKTHDSEKKELVVSMIINNTTKDVKLTYTLDDKNNFKASGKIDVLEFGASEALSSINKACYKLHEGKTWSDVEINIEGKISAKC